MINPSRYRSLLYDYRRKANKKQLVDLRQEIRTRLSQSNCGAITVRSYCFSATGRLYHTIQMIRNYLTHANMSICLFTMSVIYISVEVSTLLQSLQLLTRCFRETLQLIMGFESRFQQNNWLEIGRRLGVPCSEVQFNHYKLLSREDH